MKGKEKLSNNITFLWKQSSVYTGKIRLYKLYLIKKCTYNISFWRKNFYSSIFKHTLKNLLGTPETSLRGRRTLMARRVRRSTPSPSSSLETSSGGEMSAIYLRAGQGRNEEGPLCPLEGAPSSWLRPRGRLIYRGAAPRQVTQIEGWPN